MKKILLMLCGLSLCTSLFAGGGWDMIKNLSSEGTIKTKQYTISVSGVDIRGYAYDVPEMKSVCWQVFTKKSHQMECKTYKEMGVK